jgi:hypothetical protein
MLLPIIDQQDMLVVILHTLHYITLHIVSYIHGISALCGPSSGTKPNMQGMYKIVRIITRNFTVYLYIQKVKAS